MVRANGPDEREISAPLLPLPVGPLWRNRAMSGLGRSVCGGRSSCWRPHESLSAKWRCEWAIPSRRVSSGIPLADRHDAESLPPGVTCGYAGARWSAAGRGHRVGTVSRPSVAANDGRSGARCARPSRQAHRHGIGAIASDIGLPCRTLQHAQTFGFSWPTDSVISPLRSAFCRGTTRK